MVSVIHNGSLKIYVSSKHSKIKIKIIWECCTLDLWKSLQFITFIAICKMDK